MTLKQAIRIVEQHQRWRRDPNVPPRTKMVNPFDVGKAIDVLVLVAKEYAKIHDMNGVKITPKTNNNE